MGAFEFGHAGARRPLPRFLERQELATTRVIDPLGAPRRVFALLDACDEPRIPVKSDELGPTKAACLYAGSAHESLWAIAPYVFLVDRELEAWIATELAGTPWGYFLESRATLDSVRLHFKKFLLVRDAAGEELYFRFYDPRVVCDYVESCSELELTTFMGPIERLIVPALDGGPWISYSKSSRLIR